jgi:hypothetical protein
MFHGPAESEALHKALDGQAIAELSEAEQQAVKSKLEALDRFFADRVQARYKIEVTFGKDRSTKNPFAGAISLFLSGTKLNGGGDEKLYICPREDCQGIIFPNERLGSSVRCRACDMMWDEQKLVGEYLYRLPAQKWAEVIFRFFTKLEHNADIYLKYHPTDIRSQTQVEIARKAGGDEIAAARRGRLPHIYPLTNIIKDTNAGADLLKRFYAFITA